jgi:epidermal growth factor receptor substrate 15
VTGVSEFDLLGDTDMSTKIALESGEIKNYKLQSENLNKATSDLKTNRANVESNISSLVTQKQDMMTQLSQIRTLYESESKAMREIQAKYELEHESVERARQELLQAENGLKALQLERDQLQANIQKDRDETFDIKRRMRIIEEETVLIKAEIEKHKKDEKQQKGFLAINRKQLAAVEGEKEKAFKTLQSFEDKNSHSDEINDPFGNGVFTPLAFNPSNTTQGPGILPSQPIVDFNDFQKSSNHSHHGSISSISGSREKRSMSNASVASNSTLGTSSIKSVPLNTNKSDEISFDKPITVASSKPSEFESLLSDKLSSTPQEITANVESNKANPANPFESTFNDPFGVASNDQTNKSTQNNEESMTKQDIVKETEKSEADPFANLNNVPTPVKSVSNNDDLSSDSFTKEFPSIEELEASMTNVSNSGFDNEFTSLTTNNEKKDNNLKNANNLMETIQNEKSETTLSTVTTEAVSVNHMEINTDNKDTNNTSNKESESPFSIFADSTGSAETTFPPLQDPDAWVSIESAKSIAPQDEFDAAFGDLTEAKVTKTPPIEFDTGFDDADFEEDVNFTFDAPTTHTISSSTSNNNTLTSFKTDNFAKSSIDFDKDFDDFDPFPPNAQSSNKPKANLDAAFGSISAEPPKTNSDDFGFEDAFAEFIPTDKKSTTNSSIKALTLSQPKLQPTSSANTIIDDDVDDVKRLTAMGYSREKVVKALEQNNYDFEKSLNFLVDNS